MNKDYPLLIIGAGGHASVLAEIIKQMKLPVLGVVALQPQQIKGYEEYPYLGADDVIKNYDPNTIRLINAIGSVSVEGNAKREALFQKYTLLGYQFATLIHPSAVVASTALLGAGAQVMPLAIIQANAVIGQNTIINTRASIDHDCHIGQSDHIAPGVTLSGNVKVGDLALVGVGSTIIQGITVGDKAMICAGAVVVHNVQANEKIMGVYRAQRTIASEKI